ncbi:rhodanese-like domain-containing protein [Mesonia sp. MT50]|uniref:Rhodanese-like domain-containing protein n=1 Tax=Mesonia profundi TaxID=3070998 RepID=A0ABU1A1F8_9FLAO|nr:rhodanese-like domain-containing protein [Mesonia profundi]MDQ7917542.1 rhodanese-like domain-containing protein [Mesonia profundi]
MGIFSFLFGNKAKMIKDFKARGAVIIDVRSKGEYAGGAIPGSKNIPLPQINTKVEEIKKMNKPVITCCASGMRSSSAVAVLKSKGVECINGGGWFNLSQKLN